MDQKGKTIFLSLSPTYTYIQVLTLTQVRKIRWKKRIYFCAIFRRLALSVIILTAVTATILTTTTTTAAAEAQEIPFRVLYF